MHRLPRCLADAMGCKTGELLGPFGVTPHLAPPPPTTLPSRTWTAATWFPSRESANCQPRVLMESTDESSSSRQTFVCALQRPKDREERFGEANRLFRKRTPGLHSVGHSRQDGVWAFSVDAPQKGRFCDATFAKNNHTSIRGDLHYLWNLHFRR